VFRIDCFEDKEGDGLITLRLILAKDVVKIILRLILAKYVVKMGGWY
jgi:hypothetical protein